MYEIIFTKVSLKQLKKIPRKDQSAITAKLDDLSNDPKHIGTKALQGNLAPYHRMRCGDYRVSYSIENEKLLVVVVKIGRRRNIYA